MLTRPLVFLAFATVVAVAAPKFVPGLIEKSDQHAVPADVTPAKAAPASAGITLKASRSGHFEGRFRLNGKTVDAMIDTGATYIALNEETARSLGIGPERLRYLYSVQTANGTAQAARVTLNSVEIGSIRVRNVEALVLRDGGLNSILIGMSFMRKLSSWKVEDDRMQMVN